MLTPVKLVITSKKNLSDKYGSQISKIETLLNKLKKADKAKGLDTKLVYLDDAVSCRQVGVRRIKTMTNAECKRIVDDLYNKLAPAYIVILGAGDIVPFQEINNPADDDDEIVLSDLPYACNTKYSTSINSFIGPTRVVGRIPDKSGKQNTIAYLETLIKNSIDHQPMKRSDYMNYFSVSAQVWTKSTQRSLTSMFDDCGRLINSPLKSETTDAKYTKTQLKPLTHFYNCHGSKADPCFYGQKGKNNYPVALASKNLAASVSKGTMVAAECCYGAELYDTSSSEAKQDGIALTYLENGAIAFLGSSTIAYGPSDSNALADLITQYFIKSNLKGDVSTGRALLEARQRFLTDSGPQLDPYELKTLAQFYLLGDPSVVPVKAEVDEGGKSASGTTIFNTRAALSTKGLSLQESIEPSRQQRRQSKPGNPRELNKLLKDADFADADKMHVYSILSKYTGKGKQKKVTGETARYRAYIKPETSEDNFKSIKVLVVKEDNDQLLGWRTYESR
jgi:hypothetical protein